MFLDFCAHSICSSRNFSLNRQADSADSSIKKEEEPMRILEVLDLVSNSSEIIDRPKLQLEKQENNEDDEDTIVCNSARMIREKLTISEGEYSVCLSMYLQSAQHCLLETLRWLTPWLLSSSCFL